MQQVTCSIHRIFRWRPRSMNECLRIKHWSFVLRCCSTVCGNSASLIEMEMVFLCFRMWFYKITDENKIQLHLYKQYGNYWTDFSYMFAACECLEIGFTYFWNLILWIMQSIQINKNELINVMTAKFSMRQRPLSMPEYKGGVWGRFIRWVSYSISIEQQ